MLWNAWTHACVCENVVVATVVGAALRSRSYFFTVKYFSTTPLYCFNATLVLSTLILE